LGSGVLDSTTTGELLHWRDPATWARPCGLAVGVTKQLQESLPNLKIEVDTIAFGVSEDEEGAGAIT
jgi:hypothetical protein